MSWERALRAAVRGEVAFDDYSRHLFSRDASMYAVRPLGWSSRATPTMSAQRSRSRAADRVTRAAARARASPVRRSGAPWSSTSRGHMPGSSRSTGGAERGRDRRRPGPAQPAAAAHGLCSARHLTSNRATLGGMIGNNSSGTHSIRYGTTVDHVSSSMSCSPTLDLARLDRSTRTSGPGGRRGTTPEGAALPRAPRIVGAAPRGRRRATRRGLAAFRRLPPRPDGWHEAALGSTWPASSPAPRARWPRQTEDDVALVPRPDGAGSRSATSFSREPRSPPPTTRCARAAPGRADRTRTILDLSR